MSERSFLFLFVNGQQKLSWCHAAKPFLIAFIVVEADVFSNSFIKFTIFLKMSKIIHFGLQYAPEAFHRGIVQALSGTRHTLTNLFLFQLFAESSAGILCASVTMDQGPVIVAL